LEKSKKGMKGFLVLASLFAACVCLKDVVQYYGYIEVNQKYNANLFYWFFESQNRPATDPVVLWLTGGPGCSSELALLFENGPFTVDGEGNTSDNPYSWNSFANLLYVDQPAGTGFSYANEDYVTNETQVGNEMLAFLQGFFTQYPQYSKQPFYVTGESYGGHYVPSVALRILLSNEKHTGTHINLKGIAIGNGWVDPRDQYAGYGPFAYQNNLIDATTYQEMNQTVIQCQQYIDQKDWNDADNTCGSIMQDVLNEAGNINYYNIDLQCVPPPLCYDLTNITNYLNEPSVQETLGVSDQGITWAACSDQVNGDFGVDREESFRWEIPTLLAANISTVIYNGDLDLICNWVGGKMWVEGMRWAGKAGFNKAPMKTWRVDGTAVGQSKTYRGFTFVRVFQAGHMVPHDQPPVALELLRHLVTGKPFN